MSVCVLRVSIGVLGAFKVQPDAVATSIEYRLPVQKVGSSDASRVKLTTCKMYTCPCLSLAFDVVRIGQ